MQVKQASVGTEKKRDESCTEHDGLRGFHYVSQNGVPFKIYELFISEISYLIFSTCSKLRIPETVETLSLIHI